MNEKNTKKAFLLYLMILLPLSSFYAADSGSVTLGGLQDVLVIAIYFFQSMYMKAILTVALCFTTFQLVTNRNDPAIVKKFIPLVVASGVLLSASALVGLVFKDTSEAASYWSFSKKF